MKILIANDDGIKAAGIAALVGALSKEAEIYVCAPHVQRSASGHSISIHSPLEVKEVEFTGAAMALEITGTPADCVKLGLKVLEEKGIKIDMVFSGINHGGNLGTDTLYSGTVSAAMEGCFCKKPSVAVSVCSMEPQHFEYAAELAVKVLRKAGGSLDSSTVININVPDLPKEEIKGVQYVKLGIREYKEWFEKKLTSEGGTQYWYKGQAVRCEEIAEEEVTDVLASQQGYVTITPLHFDMTNYELMDEIKGWRIEE